MADGRTYESGEQICVGDRVRHAGRLGSIVAVIDRGEYAENFPSAEWSNYQRGFIVKDDSGELYMYDVADEDLELLRSAIGK